MVEPPCGGERTDEDRRRRAARNENPLKLELIVPWAADLLAPKLRRGEPRDRAHAAWAKVQGLI